MMPISKQIIQHYMDNPNTDESALEVAIRFNYQPEVYNELRAKRVRDLKRTAMYKLGADKPLTPNDQPTQITGTYDENLDKGTLEVSKLVSTQPRSSEEIIEIHKIDRTKWRLVQYWSKEKQSGWLVSALFASIKPEDTFPQDIENVLREVFLESNITPYPTPRKSPIASKKGLFVYMSDKHVGALTHPNSIFNNQYNEDVFEVRMMRVLEEIEKQVKTYGRLEDLFICDLGDSLDGWNGHTTRGGHALPQNMNNKESFMTYLYAHKRFFDLLVEKNLANNIHAIMQTEDNHSGSFGYITNQALTLYLNTAYPFIKVTIMEKFLEHFDYGKHTFIFTHGKDSEDLKHGLPLFLTEKAENFLNKYIDHHNLGENKNISIVKGDLHTESMQQVYKFRYRNVLSMYGSSKWIMNNFGPGYPGVSFDLVEKDIDSFCAKFENHLNSKELINEALTVYQDIQARLTRIGTYASLQTTTDSISEDNQMRQGKAMIRFQSISKKMAFLTDRKRAQGLGSAGTGTEHFIHQRISAFALIPLIILFLIFVVIGASISLGAVIDFSDAMIFAMVVPNIIGVLLLTPVVNKELKRYMNAINKKDVAIEEGATDFTEHL